MIRKNKKGGWIVDLRLKPNKYGLKRFKRIYQTKAIAEIVYTKINHANVMRDFDVLDLTDLEAPPKRKPEWPRTDKKDLGKEKYEAITRSLLQPADSYFKAETVPGELMEYLESLNRVHRTILKPSIYFLCKDGRVVYVGQSINLFPRISQHQQDKDFDEVYFLNIDRAKLDLAEACFIRLLNPPLNRIYPYGVIENNDATCTFPGPLDKGRL